MSKKIIEELLEKFITNEEPEVMVIRGEWGVGKTFLWESFVKNNDDIKSSNYSYVSLFDIDSKIDFERKIYREMIYGNDEYNNNCCFKNFYNWVKEKFNEFIKSGPAKELGKTPYVKECLDIIDLISTRGINNAIICIDDLERKGDSLTLNAIFSIILELKERRNCKIVIIYNDNKLDKSEKNYMEFMEKVVDIEIDFSISPEECCDLVEFNPEFRQQIKKHVETLNQTNIRILKKIKTLSDLLYSELSKYSNEILFQALSTLTLFACCSYSKDDDLPLVEDLLTFNYLDYIVNENINDNNPKATKLQKLLHDYGYRNADSFDHVIIEGIKMGYFDNYLLNYEARNLDEKLKKGLSEADFEKAWDIYHDSFYDNEQDLIEKLKDSFYKNYSCISPINLDGTVRLFRNLGYSDLADNLIELYIRERKHEVNLFDIDNFPFKEHIKDENLIKQFSEVKEQHLNNLSLKEVLSKFSKGTYGKQEKDLLDSRSSQEYYELLKTSKGKEFLNSINTIRELYKMGKDDESFVKIRTRIQDAVDQIARENKLNALRVLRHGFEVK